MSQESDHRDDADEAPQPLQDGDTPSGIPLDLFWARLDPLDA